LQELKKMGAQDQSPRTELLRSQPALLDLLVKGRLAKPAGLADLIDGIRFAILTDLIETRFAILMVGALVHWFSSGNRPRAGAGVCGYWQKENALPWAFIRRIKAQGVTLVLSVEF
jgi:hypothetical protein